MPLQFKPGEGADKYQLSGDEYFSIPVIQAGDKSVTVSVTDAQGTTKCEIEMVIRIDTENEFQYYVNGGILHYVIRNLLG